MKIPAWDHLPENMKNDAVKYYYDIIADKKLSLNLKRAFDICGSAGLLTALSPVFAGIAAWIKLDSPGPAIYSQERVTSFGRHFNIKKFRTMVTGADKIGSLVTVNEDPRITASGKFLRKFRLDELPQLINVLRGEMSFVGTRPEVPKYVEAYTPEMLATLLMPAGVTSQTSIKYKDEEKLLKASSDADSTYINEILPQKMKHNLESLKNFSFLNDIRTMVQTVFAVAGMGADKPEKDSAKTARSEGKKTVLYIDHYAGSLSYGMEYRPYYFAREWINDGNRVEILAADYSHLRVKNPEVKKDLEQSEVDGVPFRWLKTLQYSGNGAKRAITMFMFAGKLCLYSGKIANCIKPDVVIASSTYPLDTYGARLIAKKSRAKYIHEVHDMWPATLIELGGMSEKHPFIRALQKAENDAYKHADTIVALLPCTKNYMMSHGMEPGKFNYIPNGICVNDWENPAELPAEHKKIIEEQKKAGKTVICYFGGHALSNALDSILEAAQLIRDRKDIVIVFVGNGVEKPRLIDKANALGLDNVIFLPPVPKLAVPSLLKATDAIVICGSKSPLYRFGVCLNKLFDSMMSAKPIIYSLDSPNNDVTDSGCGISPEAGNIQAIADAFCRISDMSAQEREEMGLKGKKLCLEKYDYAVLAKKFFHLF